MDGVRRLAVGGWVLLYILTHIGFMEALVYYKVALCLVNRVYIFIMINMSGRF